MALNLGGVKSPISFDGQIFDVCSYPDTETDRSIVVITTSVSRHHVSQNSIEISWSTCAIVC